MPYFNKYFTVEEANALIPKIRELYEDIQREIERLKEDQEAINESLKAVKTNGGGKKLDQFYESNQLIHERLSEILGMGVQVKDVQRGLLDFPALRDGEEVLLCWLVDEPSVQFWHDLETGFMGRRSIDSF